MCTTLMPATEDALAERLFQATIHTLELYSVHLGVRLGLYTALVEHGPLDAAGLAERAGIDTRYAREWLEQQAVAGFLSPDCTGGDPERRRFLVPESHAAVLHEPDAAAHVAPFAGMVAGIGAALPDVVRAYRTGEGVPYARYGAEFRDGQGGINRPAFQRELTGSWLPAVGDVHARLLTAPSRIADLGCGQGWAAIALAEAYPRAEVVGVDADDASVRDARERGAARGSRARFECADASRLGELGPFDLVVVLEALHDMAQPHEALRAARAALAPGGCVLVADERVADEFAPGGDEIERMMYGWSVTHCLPVSRAEAPSRAIGTAIRPATVRALADEAGFARCEVLDIENDLFRFYRLGTCPTSRPRP